MPPKQQPKAPHDDIFRARLDQIINMKHELVVLADRIDWAWLDDELAECFFVTVVNLQATINRFVKEHYQTEAKPFIWKAAPDKIIAVRKRGFQTLGSIHWAFMPIAAFRSD
jgi:hypothetical protein